MTTRARAIHLKHQQQPLLSKSRIEAPTGALGIRLFIRLFKIRLNSPSLFRVCFSTNYHVELLYYMHLTWNMIIYINININIYQYQQTKDCKINTHSEGQQSVRRGWWSIWGCGRGWRLQQSPRAPLWSPGRQLSQLDLKTTSTKCCEMC